MHWNGYFLVSSIQLSPYNYERIEVVLKVMQAVDDNGASFPVNQVNTHTHIIKLNWNSINIILLTFHSTGNWPP